MAQESKKPAAKKVVAKEIVKEVPVSTTENWEKVKKPVKVKDEWEIRDRYYILKNGSSPLTHTIPSRHTTKHALLYFDKEAGVQKEIRYATNMSSPFKAEQVGEATLGHIQFKNGSLVVAQNKQNLQKLLSLYHPLRDRIYEEFSSIAEAEDDLELMDMQTDAAIIAREMDVDDAEAILRVEQGSKVSTLSSKELRRDIRLFARRNPQLFLELASDDNVQLRNIAIKATEEGIIQLSADQRTFMWASTGRKLMNVPFDESPYSAMAAYFKTDEGMEVFRSIQKKFN